MKATLIIILQNKINFKIIIQYLNNLNLIKTLHIKERNLRKWRRKREEVCMNCQNFVYSKKRNQHLEVQIAKMYENFSFCYENLIQKKMDLDEDKSAVKMIMVYEKSFQ